VYGEYWGGGGDGFGGRHAIDVSDATSRGH
jgi:hypothetical protein